MRTNAEAFAQSLAIVGNIHSWRKSKWYYTFIVMWPMIDLAVQFHSMDSDTAIPVHPILFLSFGEHANNMINIHNNNIYIYIYIIIML